jgi:hypothetical protein
MSEKRHVSSLEGFRRESISCAQIELAAEHQADLEKISGWNTQAIQDALI